MTLMLLSYLNVHFFPYVRSTELQPGNRAACVGLGIVTKVGFGVDARA